MLGERKARPLFPGSKIPFAPSPNPFSNLGVSTFSGSLPRSLVCQAKVGKELPAQFLEPPLVGEPGVSNLALPNLQRLLQKHIKKILPGQMMEAFFDPAETEITVWNGN